MFLKNNQKLLKHLFLSVCDSICLCKFHIQDIQLLLYENQSSTIFHKLTSTMMWMPYPRHFHEIELSVYSKLNNLYFEKTSKEYTSFPIVSRRKIIQYLLSQVS